MTNFANLNEDEVQVAGGGGGSFAPSKPEEGVALLRLREVVEFGANNTEYQGTPKVTRPVSLTFELVHPRHAIKKDDGTFIRNHEVSVRLNKSNSDMSKYMKLFNKLNYAGTVATPPGKIPAFNAFIGKAFLGEIHLNGEYVNLDKDGTFTIGAPMVPEIDATTGAPSGSFKDIDVPEMTGDVRCFLWETGVSDDVYREMWDSIAIVGEKRDGTPFKNWMQESILRTEDEGKSKANIELPGSRAERLFGPAAADIAKLDADLAVDDCPFDGATTPGDGNSPVVDPLAGLGV